MSQFTGINRPYACARTEKELPVGDKPLQLYSLATPNGIKVAVMLEELELEYDAHTISIMQRDQFTTGFTAISPNQKIPALVDKSGPDGKETRVFESASILLYLANKTGKLIPAAGTPEYVECMNWVFFAQGAVGPLFGQFGHFYKYANDKIPYAIDRYAMEVKKLLDVLDLHLAGKQYMVGEEFSIADICLFPWVRCLDLGYNAKDYLYNQAFGRQDKYENVEAWVARCVARPSVAKATKVTAFGSPSCFGDDKGTPIAGVE